MVVCGCSHCEGLEERFEWLAGNSKSRQHTWKLLFRVEPKKLVMGGQDAGMEG